MAKKIKTDKPAEKSATIEKPAPVATAAAAEQAPARKEPVPNQPASDETRAHRAPTHEEISRRAYELWAKRGGMGGNAQEDWFRAEQELRGAR